MPSPTMNGAPSNGAAPSDLAVVPTDALTPTANGQASPGKPWHQLDPDMCLVPQQWTLPACSTTLSHMLTSNRPPPPATLPVLTRDEAASMSPTELRMHLSVLREQLALLQSVNQARKVTSLVVPVPWATRAHTVLRCREQVAG
jgi:hypothetical protein